MATNAISLPTTTLTAFEMQRRPAAFQRQALQSPVTITSNGEPTLVVLSVAEYRRLLQAAGRGVFPAEQNNASDMTPVMRRTDAVSRLLKHRDQLVQLGVAHVALFGSIARDQADELSDVDIIVDTANGEAPGMFALARMKDQLSAILGRTVDVISRRGLDHTTRLKRRVAADIIDVF
jgi:predicted nucleotidyltransferase